MPKINIRTLNGIRSAAAPKGRDVAEAFDDVVATVNKLATSVAALVPNEPIQTVQISKPTSGVTQNPAPGASAGGGGGGGTPASSLWSSLTGDLTETQVIPWDGATQGTPDTGLSRISANLVGAGDGTAGDISGGISLTALIIAGSLTDNSASTGTSGQVLTAGTGGEVEWASPSSAVTSVSNSDGTLTISPTTGAVVASLALGHANTWTATQTFATIAVTTLSGNPAFSGTPTFANPVALGSSTATTQTAGTNNTTLATTAFVTTAVSAGDSFSAITTGTNTAATMTVGSGASIVLSGTGNVTANTLAATVTIPAAGVTLAPATGSAVSLSNTALSGTFAIDSSGLGGKVVLSANSAILTVGSTSTASTLTGSLNVSGFLASAGLLQGDTQLDLGSTGAGNGAVITGFGSTSGNATITWPAVAGTVTNNIVSSNGWTFNAGITVGVAGTRSGVLTLAGVTSGTCTLTAPSVAGTSTNAIVSTNNISAPAFVSTVAVGTAPFTVTSTTVVPNLNASTLGGATFASPGAIGGTTPGAGTFTTLVANTSLHVGVAGTTAGVLTLEGSTSGACTLTAPAVAGTATNAIAFSNSINLSGASTVYQAQGTPGVTQTAEAVGTLATTGGIVTTFTAVSDERLKIHQPYEGGLTEILAISPIRYRWNEEGQRLSGQKGDRDYVGFSAQNTQKSIPETIQSVTKDGYLSFEDRPIIAALVNSVKELQAQIEDLRNRH
jgi:hypothetical protein